MAGINRNVSGSGDTDGPGRANPTANWDQHPSDEMSNSFGTPPPSITDFNFAAYLRRRIALRMGYEDESAYADQPSDMPYSYLRPTSSNAPLVQTPSQTFETAPSWPVDDQQNLTSGTDGEPSDPSTMDFNYAAYLRNRAATSRANTSEDESDLALVEPCDPFNMDEAERQLLKKPPACFIVIGKPGSGKTTLSRLLAAWWRAVYINGEDLLEDLVSSRSELATQTRSLLHAGVAVPEKLLLSLLDERLRQEDVLHYGYVLDGLPCLSERVLSQLGQLQMVLSAPLPPSVIIHLRISDEDLISRVESYRFDEDKGRVYTWVQYTEKPKPPPKKKKPREPKEEGEEAEEEEEEEEEEVEEEEEAAPTMEDDLFEEEEGEDEEVEEEEENEEEMGEEEELQDEEDELGEERREKPPKEKKEKIPKRRKRFNPLTPAPKEIWDQLLPVPEGKKARFTTRLEKYKKRLMLLLEDYMTSHSPEMLIELDATLTPREVFECLRYRLGVLPISRALMPVRLLEDGGPPGVSTGDDPEEIKHVLSRTNALCMRFKWTPSDFGVTCPVSMQNGRVVAGDPEFAVGFLDHFYVTADAEALAKFKRNPRQYVGEPPRLPCRVIVCGPPGSGRTTLAAQIASHFAGVVVDVAKASEAFLDEKKEKHRTEMREEKRHHVEEEFKEKRRQEREEAERLQQEERERIQKEEEERAKKEAEERERIQKEEEERAKKEAEEREAAKAKEEQAKEKEEGEQGKEEAKGQVGGKDNQEKGEAAPAGADSTGAELGDTQTASEPQQPQGEEDGTDGQPQPEGDLGEQEEAAARASAGEESESRTGPDNQSPEGEPGNRDSPQEDEMPQEEGPDPEVEAVMEEFSEELEAAVGQVQLEPEDWLRVLQETVARTEQERHAANPALPAYGGWVLDNVPINPQLWELMTDAKFEYDDVVCIWDESEDFLFLRDYYYRDNYHTMVEHIETSRIEEQTKEAEKAAEQLKKEQEQAKVEAERQEQEAIAQQMQAIMGGKTGPDEGTQQRASPTGDQAEETKPADESRKPSPEAPTNEMASPDHGTEDGEGSSPLPPPAPPPACPMMDAYREQLTRFSEDWSSVRSLAELHNSSEPIQLSLDRVVREGTKLLAIVAEKMCAGFRQVPHELGGEAELNHEFGEVDDEVEEDEEPRADDESEEEEEGKEDEEADEEEKTDLKKLYGETAKFCPVMFAQRGVLQPGQEEFAVSYRGQLYLTSSQEAMEALIANPDRFIPKETCMPPPLRIFLLGAYGSGKSDRGQQLAERCGVFFINFPERLQEEMLKLGRPRTGKRYGTEVAGEMSIEDDIQEVLQETVKMRAEFEERQAERRGARGDEEEEASPPGSPPALDAAAGEEGSEDAEEAEAERRRQERADWAEWQVEVEDYLAGELAVLSPDTLDELVQPLWEREPFKSTGFVLEGFPCSQEDLQYLVERHLFPDAVVELATDSDQTVSRLLEGRMAEWQAKMDGYQGRLKEAREAKVAERTREVDERKKELQEEIDAREKRREERLKAEVAATEAEGEEEELLDDEPPEGSDMPAADEERLEEERDEEEEEEEEIDVEQVIADEFPELEDSELTWETKEEAKERISDILQQWHEEDAEAVRQVKEAAEEALIPWIEVDGRRKASIVDFLLARATEKYTTYRAGLMQRAYPIGTNMAAALIDIGYRQLSKFGKQCPVTLKERGMMTPPFNPTQRRPYPVIFRRSVYFCVSREAQAKFVRNPVLYAEQRPPLYMIPSRVAVLGPPKSGKTAVACDLSSRHGLLRLSPGEAVRALLARWPPLQLAERVRRHLADGQAVPEQLLVEAAGLALLSVPAQVHGYVLDGWPQSERQACALTAAGIQPYLVLHLDAEDAVTVRRARRQENWFRAEQAAQEGAASRRRPPAEEPRLETPLAHCVRLAAWKQTSERLAAHFQQLHGNVAHIDANGCLWSVEAAARSHLQRRLEGIYQYRECVARGRPAPIGALCITPDELEVRLGPYRHYCAVCWRDGRLVDRSADRDLTHAVEIGGRYYRACGADHQAALLAAGEECVPPRAAPLPAELPCRLTALDTATLLPALPLAFGGFCAVTFVRGGRRPEALARGDPALGVGFLQQVHLCATEEARAAFMEEPRRYAGCTLPAKVPPPAAEGAPQLDRLPMPGYLEQALGGHLVRVVTEVGRRRPKHPQLTVTGSALTLAGLLLRQRAAGSECTRGRWERRLAAFESACCLAERLGRLMGSAGSDPRRLPDRDRDDLETFVALTRRPPEAVYRDAC